MGALSILRLRSHPYRFVAMLSAIFADWAVVLYWLGMHTRNKGRYVYRLQIKQAGMKDGVPRKWLHVGRVESQPESKGPRGQRSSALMSKGSGLKDQHHIKLQTFIQTAIIWLHLQTSGWCSVWVHQKSNHNNATASTTIHRWTPIFLLGSFQVLIGPSRYWP